MNMGANGVAIGRNIINDGDPIAMVKALNQIVHGDGMAEEANKIYKTKKGAFV
jgi:fructose-bisphosphate aldolase, class I